MINYKLNEGIICKMRIFVTKSSKYMILHVCFYFHLRFSFKLLIFNKVCIRDKKLRLQKVSYEY